MAFVQCRECGHEIKADTRQTRCEKCGTFFPFTCAVCEKFLRPPFAIYEDERYVTDDGKPLCLDHYQRQCPECHNWFQADQNPGFFLCPECAKARLQRAAKPAPQPKIDPAVPITPGVQLGERPAANRLDIVVYAAISGAAILGIGFLLYRMFAG